MAEDRKIGKQHKKRDRIGLIMYLMYLAFLLLTGGIIARIIQIQVSYEPDPETVNCFRPKTDTITLDPGRGAILARDGRVLAISEPEYQVYMDCTVMKDAYAGKPDKEQQWRDKARGLAAGLAMEYGNGSAEDYYNLIITSREAGKMYVRIGHRIDHEQLQRVKALPLFNEDANKGGFLYEEFDSRKYPYNGLAARTIGYVKDNSRSNGNNHIGIEGKFDYKLHGEEGSKIMKVTDDRNKISVLDVKPVDGDDVRLTIDVDLQMIADEAVRKQIEANPGKVEGGCAIIMEVETGAIRAMVNLNHDKKGNIAEITNSAISRKSDPGSVMKSATLMTVLDDAKVELSDELATNHGILAGYPTDEHVVEYEWSTGRNTMSVLHGFEISSNYLFRKLAIDYYGDNPQNYINRLFSYKLAQDYDFDLVGFAKPDLPMPGTAGWSGTSLGSVAIGYSITLTPLHVCTFYNTIANRGRMMKPYLVECFEKDGKVTQRRGSETLGAICEKSTADTLAKALSMVVEEGTGRRVLGSAVCAVAGKTGTARVVTDGKYEDAYGRVTYQGTFVGFFPAQKPKYTCIVVMYSYPGSGILYGAGAPAKAYREIVDRMWPLEDTGGSVLTVQGKVPAWNKLTAKNEN